MLQNHLPGQEGTIHDNKDMEKLDILLVITPHSVSLSQIESLTPGDTLSSNAHFILTTQQKKNLAAQRLHSSVRLQVHTHTNSYHYFVPTVG